MYNTGSASSYSLIPRKTLHVFKSTPVQSPLPKTTQLPRTIGGTSMLPPFDSGTSSNVKTTFLPQGRKSLSLSGIGTSFPSTLQNLISLSQF